MRVFKIKLSVIDGDLEDFVHEYVDAELAIDLDRVVSYNDEFDGETRVDLSNGHHWVICVPFKEFHEIMCPPPVKKQGKGIKRYTVMRRKKVNDTRRFNLDTGKNPEEIPLYGGRPNRNNPIEKDDVTNLRIILSRVNCPEEFLEEIK